VDVPQLVDLDDRLAHRLRPAVGVLFAEERPEDVVRLGRGAPVLRVSWERGRYSVVLPSKCSEEAWASAFVTCTMPSARSGARRGV
jgi:hypothetical protein